MQQEMMQVVRQKEIAPKIFELVLTGELVKEMQQSGQFLHVRVPRNDLLLRRPISLAKINQNEKTCTLIYRVEGLGTAALSLLGSQDKLDVMGPLGNHFPIDYLQKNDEVLIIGGGIGVPPLYELGRQLVAKGVKPIFVFGYATEAVQIYPEKFADLGKVYLATDDGSAGLQGHVGHLLTQDGIKNMRPAAVYACGAKGMLMAVQKNYQDHPHAYLSLEERMACGMGACYACICQDAKQPDKNKKVCEDGPIFQVSEVVL